MQGQGSPSQTPLPGEAGKASGSLGPQPADGTCGDHCRLSVSLGATDKDSIITSLFLPPSGGAVGSVWPKGGQQKEQTA